MLKIFLNFTEPLCSHSTINYSMICWNYNLHNLCNSILFINLYLNGFYGFVECSSNNIFFSVFPTPTIVDCGGLITDVTESTPNIPMLLTVVVPPWYYLGSSFPYLALFAISLVLLAISNKPRVSALKTIGVINPPYVATATLTSAYLNFLTVFLFHCTLTLGRSLNASAIALIMISLTLIFTPFYF